jgi:hypothetical protein
MHELNTQYVLQQPDELGEKFCGMAMNIALVPWLIHITID